MKIACLSDLHGQLPKVPDCDLVLISGDIAPFLSTADQITWLDTEFRYWLDEISPPVVAIAGNHDEAFQFRSESIPKLPWHYLQDSEITIKGLRIWGSPWSLTYGNFAFMQDEDFLNEVYSKIPEGIDIILSHTPPFGYLDYVYVTKDEEDKWFTKKHCGSHSLLQHIKRVNPKLVVFGHIHPGAGISQLDNTTLINAALVNDSIEICREPYIFTI